MNTPKKDRFLFSLLAILLGSLGIQFFYLNRPDKKDTMWGVVSILFCWTGIPALVGLIIGIIALIGTDAEFAARYGVEVENTLFGSTNSESKPATSNADELAKYKKLYDDGAITAEEYEKKKQELL